MVKVPATKRKDSGPAPAGFQSLLVPVDLTPSSDRVLGRASLLPLAADARVTLLHVVPASLSPPEQRRAERDAENALAVEARHLQERLHEQVRIEPLVRLGTAAKEIAACAGEVQAELVVMGRGGGRALSEMFLGSTAERVTRQAQLPVLVVRLPARGAYDRPALALDLDQAASEVVRLLLRVLPRPRPRVEVIHAFDIPYRAMVYPSLSEDETDGRTAELRAHATEELAKVLATALANANIPAEDRPVWKTHVRLGSPRIVVEKTARKAETDLLVLGTHAHSGAAYVLLGTVAGDLLRAAKCDVLMVPPAARE